MTIAAPGCVYKIVNVVPNSVCGVTCKGRYRLSSFSEKRPAVVQLYEYRTRAWGPRYPVRIRSDCWMARARATTSEEGHAWWVWDVQENVYSKPSTVVNR